MADGELNVDSLITRLLEGESGPGGPRGGDALLYSLLVPRALEPGGNRPSRRPPSCFSRPEAAAEDGGEEAGGPGERPPGERPGERGCPRGRAVPRGPSGTRTAARGRGAG